MKMVKTASGKQTLKMSKNEWKDMGKRVGWIKEASLNINDNIAVLLDAAWRGCDIPSYKTNPYTGMAISVEEIAQAQEQLGGTVQQGQVPQNPPPVEKVAKTKLKLIASEN